MPYYTYRTVTICRVQALIALFNNARKNPPLMRSCWKVVPAQMRSCWKVVPAQMRRYTVRDDFLDVTSFRTCTAAVKLGQSEITRTSHVQTVAIPALILGAHNFNYLDGRILSKWNLAKHLPSYQYVFRALNTSNKSLCRSARISRICAQ